MAGDRMAVALERIEAATRRIEALAASPIETTDPDLAQRYAALKREAGAALAELDALIGEFKR